jgi:hypothetical protein
VHVHPRGDSSPRGFIPAGMAISGTGMNGDGFSGTGMRPKITGDPRGDGDERGRGRNPNYYKHILNVRSIFIINAISICIQSGTFIIVTGETIHKPDNQNIRFLNILNLNQKNS